MQYLPLVFAVARQDDFSLLAMPQLLVRILLSAVLARAEIQRMLAANHNTYFLSRAVAYLASVRLLSVYVSYGTIGSVASYRMAGSEPGRHALTFPHVPAHARERGRSRSARAMARLKGTVCSYKIDEKGEPTMITERTVRVASSVPVSLAQRAAETIERERPGISMAALVRLALARLAGLPGDEYAEPLPMGPKPKQAA
jgi:hypothetical protein